jgi:hypothetical protein
LLDSTVVGCIRSPPPSVTAHRERFTTPTTKRTKASRLPFTSWRPRSHWQGAKDLLRAGTEPLACAVSLPATTQRAGNYCFGNTLARSQGSPSRWDRALGVRCKPACDQPHVSHHTTTTQLPTNLNWTVNYALSIAHHTTTTQLPTYHSPPGLSTTSSAYLDCSPHDNDTAADLQRTIDCQLRVRHTCNCSPHDNDTADDLQRTRDCQLRVWHTCNCSVLARRAL